MSGGGANASESRATPAGRGLLWKYVSSLIGLVGLVLVINAAVNAWLTYSQTREVAGRLQDEKADAAAQRIGEFIAEIERQIGWTTHVQWDLGAVEQRRLDYIRLMRQAPAISELVQIDRTGKEQLKVSRLSVDVVGSGQDYSADPRFTEAIRDRIRFSPVYFRKESEPFMTLSVARGGRNPGVTLAEVNLKLIWDVITTIRMGREGYAYVVDNMGRLIAHPDISLVLRNTEMKTLPQVAQALARQRQTRAPGGEAVVRGRDIAGRAVITSDAPIPRLNWSVLVEVPESEALATIWSALYQNLLLLVAGLLLAVLAAFGLARRMVAPIEALSTGAVRLGGGDFSHRIEPPANAGREIAALAGNFNRMGEQLRESYAGLEAKVEARTADLNESLAQQTATSDILRVISQSPTDVTPVFDAIVAAAVKLLHTDLAFVMLTDGATVTPIAGATPGGRIREMIAGRPVNPAEHFPSRAIVSKEHQQFPDWSRIDLPAHEKAVRDKFGINSSLYLPMMRGDVCVGVLTFACRQPRAFNAKEVALAESFRDQAMIAMENTRLFNETKEALEQQTATGTILGVIASSPTDIKPVLQAVARSACEVCDAYDGLVALRQGEDLLFSAHHGPIPIGLDKWPLNRNWTAGRAVLERRPVHVPDLLAPEAEEYPDGRAFSIKMGHRAIISVPLLREGEAIGAIVLRRKEPQPFTDKQIALLQTFADQAIIAINNVRLFEEVQERTRDLGEALSQQTATSEVLKVISRSAFDLDAVFHTLLESAARLCNASICILYRRDGELLRVAASYGGNPDFVRYLTDNPNPIERGSISGRAALARSTIHVPDIEADGEYATKQSVVLGGWRSIIGVPLLREGEPVGVLALARPTTGPFGQREIEVVETFADQAVIAIENARLFEEVQARTRDLEESLAFQTATSDVLNVISRSATEVKPVLEAIVQTAATLCAAEYAFIARPIGDKCHLVAANNLEAGHTRYLLQNPVPIDDSSVTGRVALNRTIIQVADVLSDPSFKHLQWQEAGKQRTVLGVPLLREGALQGVIILARTIVSPFTEKQIELVSTFADQAVIAIENARLFEEVQARTRELSRSLDDLRTAQDRLVQTEKLASLGQLTAGIAHEIKNPLNFVNNFSALSTELIVELRQALATEALRKDTREEVDELLGILGSNLDKVVQHGKRADSIVKNMLLHSRSGSGERRMVDVNALAEESLNLAFHGARAEKSGFNVTLARALDPKAGEAELYPQEITRVLLNLITNGFYAVNKRKSEGAEEGFEPTLSLSTRDLGDRVEIRIRDNGTGIPDAVKARVFDPFFTTKPAGEGTGLGLSLSHDIIVKQHGGVIDIATQPGEFTEFLIVLPRKARVEQPGTMP